MFRRPIVGLAPWLAILLAAASPAQASITAFWQQVTITPEAIANDPALASMQSWDLMSMTTGNWASARVLAVLPDSLTFYKHPLGGLTRPDPALFETSPALRFTTFVSSPSDNGTNHTTNILGGHPQGRTPSLGDPTSPTPGEFSMDWGDLVVDPPSLHHIARLTFSESAMPEVYNPPVGDFSATFQLSPDATAIIPDIPEPSMLGLIAGIPIFLRRQRNLKSAVRVTSFPAEPCVQTKAEERPRCQISSP